MKGRPIKSGELTTGTAELITDEVVDELVVHGPAEACRERVAEYHATGLDTPVIMIVPAPGVDETAAVRQLAPPA